MSAEPLFLDKGLEFMEKRAGTLTRLGDNVDHWPQEVMQEAYKRLPFLSSFEINVIFDKQDEERGYAFGSIEVRPKSDMPPSQRRQALSKVHIPLVVKEQQLYPLDIFIHGKRYNHLTEGRLRAVLFRPEMFDTPAKPPPGATFGNELTPPAVSGGWGSSGVKLGQASMASPMDASASMGASQAQQSANAGLASKPPSQNNLPSMPSMANAQSASTQLPSMGKMASVPLLPLLHGRVLSKHVDRVKEAMGNPDILASYAGADEGVQAALLSAVQLEATDPTKTAEALINSIKPDVVQMRKLANGNVLVKWAGAEAYAPQQQEVPQQQAQQMAGPQQGQQLEQQGSVTAGPTAEVQQAMGEEEAEVRPADQFGLWAVQDANGGQLVGWVFPKLYTDSMQQMPTALFTNGSQYAMQEQIAGKMLGKIIDLPKGPPQGYGAFYTTEGDRPKAFTPLQVTGTFTAPDGRVNYMAQGDDGAKVTFYFSDSVKAPVRVGDGQLIVPTGYRWLPLKAKVELVADPSLFTKTANRKWTGTVEIRGDGGVYSYSGPSVAKLASADTKFIDRDQAEFIGVLLGMDPGFAKTALNRANGGELVSVEGLRTPTPLSTKYASARASVARELSELDPPIRNYSLVKEASILDDALTADKILGLGFINAENIATFVDMIPQLEDAASKLAELLLAVRLGVKEVPEVAVERMLVALEDVINGLRTLRHKEIKFKE
jgi:hypothetical protein